MNRSIPVARPVFALGALMATTVAPMAHAQTPPAGASAPQVNIGTVMFLGESGGVDTARIVNRLTEHLNDLRRCYVTGLTTSPTLSGELQIDVTYGHNGRTTAITTTGLAAVPAVGQCVAHVVQPLHFPHPAGHEITSLHFLATVQFNRSSEAPPNG